MGYLTIRDVPDEVKNALMAVAKEQGQSLQAYLLRVLRRQADFVSNAELLVEIERDFHAAPGVPAGAPDAADVLTGERSETLGEPPAGTARPGRRR